MEKLIAILILLVFAGVTCSVLTYWRIRRYLLATVVAVVCSAVTFMLMFRFLFLDMSSPVGISDDWQALGIFFGLSMLASLPIVLSVGLVFLLKRKRPFSGIFRPSANTKGR